MTPSPATAGWPRTGHGPRRPRRGPRHQRLPSRAHDELLADWSPAPGPGPASPARTGPAGHRQPGRHRRLRHPHHNGQGGVICRDASGRASGASSMTARRGQRCLLYRRERPDRKPHMATAARTSAVELSISRPARRYGCCLRSGATAAIRSSSSGITVAPRPGPDQDHHRDSAWSRSRVVPFQGPLAGTWRKASRARPDCH